MSQTLEGNRTGISKKLQPRDFFVHPDIKESREKKQGITKIGMQEKLEAAKKWTNDYQGKMVPMLTKLGGIDYDEISNIEDMVIKVEKHVEGLKIQWKTYSMDRIRTLIRQVVVLEVTKLETRKKRRREVAEKAQADKEKREQEEDDANATANTFSFTVGKGARDDKSQTSSPYKNRTGGDSPPRSTNNLPVDGIVI